MTASSSHRLDGLEPDNLLAFLALLGLLRALEMTHPDWQPRAYWRTEEAPMTPVLTTSIKTTRNELCEAAVGGLKIFVEALRPFSWPRSKQGAARKTALFSDETRHRSLSKRCISALGACRFQTKERLVWQLRCDLIACSGGMRLKKKKDEVVEPTPLKLSSGQMAFIGSQFDIAKRCRTEHINACLFQPWTYESSGHSLRLSPDEARRYAYRANDPSPEGSRTELGATAMAGLGLLAFTISNAETHWRMIAYTGTRIEGKICWPIWGANDGPGLSYQGILAFLRSIGFDTHQDIYVTSVIRMIASARRYVLDPSQGDYGNINRAVFTFL